MGYETDYYGEIHLKSKKVIKIIKEIIEIDSPDDELFKEWDYGNVDIDEVDENDTILKISTYSKCDIEVMLKLCLFVAVLDKKSYGVIECSGEERDDVWKIVVGKGEVNREQGYINYKKDRKVEDIETKKKVYEITKDVKLLKEIMIEKLEK